jgi:hypothetical protein
MTPGENELSESGDSHRKSPMSNKLERIWKEAVIA